MNTSRGWPTREWLVITGLTMVGAVLRFWNFGRLSLSHFDEGIYAFSGLWIVSKHGLLDLDPSIVAYAPPGFPILVGLSYGLFGVSDYAAIVVAILAGIATIPIVGWLGRRTFGPGAGAGAAAFAALAMAHVAFSRKALTDAPFLFAWLVAMGAGGRFLERPGFVRALVLGVAVGVAQNFKYNGWLAGVIVALAALAGAVVNGENRRRGPLLRTFGWGLIAAFTAAILYAPWYGFVAAHGGYAELLRHHRSYMKPAGWLGNLRTQLGEAHALSGPGYTGALAALLTGLALAALSRDRSRTRPWSRRRGVVWSACTLLIPAACTWQAYFPWWLGLGLTPWLLLNERAAARLLGVWWTVMSVLTPLYHPYARLWLPLHAFGWLLMAGVLTMLWPAGLALAERSPCGRQRIVLLGIVLSCGVSAAIHVSLTRPVSMAWSWVLRPADPSLRQLAYESIPRTIPDRGSTLSIFATRPLAFYLAQLGRYSIRLVPSAEGLQDRTGVPDSWALVQKDMLEQGGAIPPFDGPTPGTRRYRGSFLFEIDPVTFLDTHPERAFAVHPLDQRRPRESHAGIIHVWAPLLLDFDPATTTGRSPQGPPHAP
jgi:4-amino-4-deoxy-L-arabinose transferase-like glycosyltransferase